MNTLLKIYVTAGFYLSEPGNKTQTATITKVTAGKIISRDKETDTTI